MPGLPVTSSGRRRWIAAFTAKSSRFSKEVIAWSLRGRRKARPRCSVLEAGSNGGTSCASRPSGRCLTRQGGIGGQAAPAGRWLPLLVKMSQELEGDLGMLRRK